MADKFVDFYQYCPTCAYQDKSDIEPPCTDCLANPVNQDSHKPTEWKEKEK